MKKILVMSLVLTMLCTMFVASVTSYAADSVVFSADNVTVKAGEQAVVTVSVTNGPEYYLAAVKVGVGYDSTYFSIPTRGYSDNRLFGSAGQFSGNITANPFYYNGGDGVALEADGAMFSITFNVAENTPAGEYPIEVVYDAKNTMDDMLELVECTTVNGSITVEADEPAGPVVTAGDATIEPNADGKYELPTTDIGWLKDGKLYKPGYLYETDVDAAFTAATVTVTTTDDAALRQNVMTSNGWTVDGIAFISAYDKADYITSVGTYIAPVDKGEDIAVLEDNVSRLNIPATEKAFYSLGEGVGYGFRAVISSIFESNLDRDFNAAAYAVVTYDFVNDGDAETTKTVVATKTNGYNFNSLLANAQ